MGYYRIYAVLLIPAARLEQTNAWLSKNGFGLDVFRRAIILQADADDHAPRGYAGILRTDTAGYETLRKSIDGLPNCYLFGSQRKATAALETLQFIADKGYKLKPVT